jgi:hypothetical protein
MQFLPLLFNLELQPIGFFPTPVVEKSSKKNVFLSAEIFWLVSDASVITTASFIAGERSGL